MTKLLILLQSLLDGLSEVDDNLWKDVKKLQRRWIGNCDGTRIDFKLKVQIRVKQGYSEVSVSLPILRIYHKVNLSDITSYVYYESKLWHFALSMFYCIVDDFIKKSLKALTNNLFTLSH